MNYSEKSLPIESFMLQRTQRYNPYDIFLEECVTTDASSEKQAGRNRIATSWRNKYKLKAINVLLLRSVPSVGTS